jgi:hypothetical protein
MSPRWLSVTVFLGAVALASTAEAAVRPFVLAGGSAIRAEKTDLDEWLDEYTIRERGKDWEAGGGLRFIPGTSKSSAANRAGAASAGESPIEMRLRFTLGGGGLPDTRFSGQRSFGFSYPPRSFLVSSRETFSYSSWAIGGFFSARLYHRAGFYVGPILQTVNYKADRAWTGPTECTQCGPATDKATSRYGAVEAGAHYTLHQFPLRLEGFWIPKRVNLTTTHKLKSANYQANFASFKGSLGARLAWEF